MLAFGAESFAFHSCYPKNIEIKIYGTIFPVDVYGCEIWSLTLREERRLCIYENGALRRIFEPERDELTGEWRKLHNKELNDVYGSPNYSIAPKSYGGLPKLQLLIKTLATLR